MAEKKELNLEEMDQISGGRDFVSGEICTVTNTTNFLAFRSQDKYDDSNIKKPFYNGEQLKYLGKANNGYVKVQDMDTGDIGYVNGKYLF